mgnify:CR=1 FL=1
MRYKRQLDNDIDGINPYGAFLYTVPKVLRAIMLVKPLKLAVMKNEVTLLEKYEKEIGQICEKQYLSQKKRPMNLIRN